MAKLSASKIAIQDYKQKLNPVMPEDESLTPGIENPEKEAAQAAYKSYLTTPIQAPAVGAEGVTGETISNVKEAYKKGGLLPAVLQGLGGILKLANTSQGQTMIAAAQPDVFGKQAGLNAAEETRGLENLQRQGAASQESERLKSLGSYEIESMKAATEAERQNALMLAQQEFEAAQQAKEMEQQERLFGKKAKIEKEREEITSFEDKRQAIYEANKNLTGAEDILSATNEEELNNIAIEKGFKLLGVPIKGKVTGKKPKIKFKKIEE